MEKDILSLLTRQTLRNGQGSTMDALQCLDQELYLGTCQAFRSIKHRDKIVRLSPDSAQRVRLSRSASHRRAA